MTDRGTPRVASRPEQQLVDPSRLTTEQVGQAQHVDPAQGLSDAEALIRLARLGPNELEAEPPIPAWRRVLAQFQDALVILLLVATAISVGVWLYERGTALPYEALAIFAIVLINAVLGYVQEGRAEQAVAALRTMSAANARVLRSGELRSVPAREVVPGDVLSLEEGDTLPADARLTQAVALRTLEAALTGESLPTEKDTQPLEEAVSALGDRHNMVFSGTAVSSGRGRAIVTATGMDTEIGRIAGLLKRTAAEATPLQQELDRTGRTLGLAVLVIAVVMIVTIGLVDGVRDFSGFVDVLILGVALAVAAVPEGLPAITSVVLALGTQRMAKHHAIVRRLPAVETLGSASVIASDKTGTLTRNEMTVRVVVTASGVTDLSGSGYGPKGDLSTTGRPLGRGFQREEVERVLVGAALANNAAVQQQGGRWSIQGDPTEGALIVAAHKAGFTSERLQARFVRVAEVPFSSERKRISTVHTDARQPGKLTLFSKGAPNVLLERCTAELIGTRAHPLSEKRRAAIRAANEALAAQALRTLGVATRTLPGNALHREATEALESELVFLGLIGMIDPPRTEARDAVARARQAGIRPMMITGDHPSTAVAIATELGIVQAGAQAMTGAELSQLSDLELERVVQEISVYARVDPEHKLRIVQALQRGGEVVAMTGDGVNDAPALRAADIGVAMGITGTDVSKEAADMVLTDDNFATIVAAIEEGRGIFDNIQKFLRYLLSSNLGEVMTMFFGVVFASLLGLVGGPGEVALPLLATQLLWINLVTDGAPALALGLGHADPDVMTRPPRPKAQGVITPEMWRGIVFVGLIVAVGTLGVLDASLPGGLITGTGTLTFARTMAFTTLMLFQLFNVFSARSDTRSAFHGLFRNRWLWGAVALSLGLHALVLYLHPLQQAFGTTALGWNDWLVCTAVASSVLWLRELTKLVKRSWTRGVLAIRQQG
ncbi:cation-translocating P-type ATPase [Deinococcus detaillensis]|uniref:Cation-translocating P-type ATPase n=1 Tax=Deinococcus detaillensis TaxID=2592048 RepID=A0A553UZ28_9DEIO|nr:cation-translocating P-type ATPase [Deinococcus detaillensis]TSA85472.1 cation-translocating P-type ATPase [Deinococcus detaillensis]